MRSSSLDFACRARMLKCQDSSLLAFSDLAPVKSQADEELVEIGAPVLASLQGSLDYERAALLSVEPCKNCVWFW